MEGSGVGLLPLICYQLLDGPFPSGYQTNLLTARMLACRCLQLDWIAFRKPVTRCDRVTRFDARADPMLLCGRIQCCCAGGSNVVARADPILRVLVFKISFESNLSQLESFDVTFLRMN